MNSPKDYAEQYRDSNEVFERRRQQRMMKRFNLLETFVYISIVAFCLVTAGLVSLYLYHFGASL